MKDSEVGNRIKDYLKTKHITQSELAVLLGVNRTVLSETLSGRRNIMPLVEKMCSHFGLSRDYLVAGEENKLSDIVANNNISENGLSHDDKVRLLDRLESLYEKHQAILHTISTATKESGDVLKEIATINRLLVVGTEM